MHASVIRLTHDELLLLPALAPLCSELEITYPASGTPDMYCVQAVTVWNHSIRVEFYELHLLKGLTRLLAELKRLKAQHDA
jgi:hypothetical protein